MAAAANKADGQKPKFEITLFLIPDWDNGEDYDSSSYKAAKAQMLAAAKDKYGDDITIKDFVTETDVTPTEMAFLRGCKSLGSIADLVKTRTLIDNQGRACLQTDSNVTWANNDFDKLYQLTFATGQDALNASRCSEVYISTHNKLVFMGPDSQIPQVMRKALLEYCNEYKDDSWHMDARCNGVYDFAFVKGMHQLGVSYEVIVDDHHNQGQTFRYYPAMLVHDLYTLNSVVVPCQRESWRAAASNLDKDILPFTGHVKDSSKISVDINGVNYDYFHFKSLVRVFTNNPEWHAKGASFKHVQQPKHLFEGVEHGRNMFIQKQDLPLKLQVLANYYDAVYQQYSNAAESLDEEKVEALGKVLAHLAHLIPDSEEGEQLVKVLFGDNCTVANLHANPARPSQLQEAVSQFEAVGLQPQQGCELRLTSSVQLTPMMKAGLSKAPCATFFRTPRANQYFMQLDLEQLARAADSMPTARKETVLNYFKGLPIEDLQSIRDLSATAREAWDSQYSLTVRL